MKRLLFLLALLAASGTTLAWNAEAILLYHFDNTQVSPADAGEPRLGEVTREGGTILWVAPPKPGKATVLYFHGNAGNLANRTGRFTAFLNRGGFGVVAMAYPPGSSGSSGSQRAAQFELLAEKKSIHPCPIWSGSGLWCFTAKAWAQVWPSMSPAR